MDVTTARAASGGRDRTHRQVHQGRGPPPAHRRPPPNCAPSGQDQENLDDNRQDHWGSVPDGGPTVMALTVDRVLRLA